MVSYGFHDKPHGYWPIGSRPYHHGLDTLLQHVKESVLREQPAGWPYLEVNMVRFQQKMNGYRSRSCKIEKYALKLNINLNVSISGISANDFPSQSHGPTVGTGLQAEDHQISGIPFCNVDTNGKQLET
jgi:hypothetical protein